MSTTQIKADTSQPESPVQTGKTYPSTGSAQQPAGRPDVIIHPPTPEMREFFKNRYSTK